MGRFLLVMMVLASTQVLAAQTETSSTEAPFQAAETLSVTDILPQVFDIIPQAKCGGNGTVVLDALISETGDLQKIEVRRDVACLTQKAVQAVEKWKFSPATFAGKAVASRVPVAVTFPPPGPFVNPVPLPALKPQSEAAIQAAFQPAELTRATFPNYYVPVSPEEVTRATMRRYPENRTFGEAAVLEITLSEKGEAEEIKVLIDCLPLTKPAKDAVGDWRFMPAAFNGHPVPSKVVLAFVSILPPPPKTRDYHH
jgi:hypothetical protein